ncbi:MFS transporter [Haladaptatus caseinilyticus]|uniref:MFS transporter n=1 Tax=Haladaptatus caseinilyticus TaxID=2993314 RepID=UPI00224B9AB5|nr:MFS transporter [Haladaptatus caseinilyticus]
MRSLFTNRTFTRLFLGRLITNAGDSVYTIAAMWLAFELGGSSFYTGLAGFLTMLPQVFQFLAGPLVDRWQLRRILVGTQVLQGIFVLAIPFAAVMGWLSVGVVLVVMPIVSLLNQFVYPAQQAALPRVVEEEELVEANSAFSFAYQGVDFVFTALGGIVVAVVGAVSLYLIDSVTFAIAALVFVGVRIPSADTNDSDRDEGTKNVTSAMGDYRMELSDGIRYVRGSVLVWVLLGSLVVNATIGTALAVLPAYANASGGPDTYGFILAAITGGMLVGSLSATPLKRFSLAALSVGGFALSGLSWLAAVAVGWLPATVGLFFLAGVPIGATNVIFSAMVQSVVPEDLMGRVSSVLASGSVGAMPLGSLLGGIGGDMFGNAVVMTTAGFGLLFISTCWLTHPLLRNLADVEDLRSERYGLIRSNRAEPSESF